MTTPDCMVGSIWFCTIATLACLHWTTQLPMGNSGYAWPTISDADDCSSTGLYVLQKPTGRHEHCIDTGTYILWVCAILICQRASGISIFNFQSQAEFPFSPAGTKLIQRTRRKETCTLSSILTEENVHLRQMKIHSKRSFIVWVYILTFHSLTEWEGFYTEMPPDQVTNHCDDLGWKIRRVTKGESSRRSKHILAMHCRQPYTWVYQNLMHCQIFYSNSLDNEESKSS